jgi:hypothetical protein
LFFGEKLSKVEFGRLSFFTQALLLYTSRVTAAVCFDNEELGTIL